MCRYRRLRQAHLWRDEPNADGVIDKVTIALFWEIVTRGRNPYQDEQAFNVGERLEDEEFIGHDM